MFDHSTLTFAVDIDMNGNLIPHEASIDGGTLEKNDRLCLKYAMTEKRKEYEELLLMGHIMLFGQLPPLNNKGPTLKYIWDKIENSTWKKATKFYKEIIGDL